MASEMSETSDESDDLRSVIQGKRTTLPDDCTIDSLLASRERDILFRPLVPSPTTSSPEGPGFVAPTDVVPLLSRDGSIFELSAAMFPMQVLSLLSSRALPDRPQFARLPDWKRQALELFPDSVSCIPSILFSMIEEYIATGGKDSPTVLIRYALRFARNSVDYSTWLSFALEAIGSNLRCLTALLAIGNYETFAFESDDRRSDARSDIVLLHFAAILCPTISECPEYGMAVRQLRASLLAADFLSDDIVGAVAERCCQLTAAVPVQNLSLWISMFPLEGWGAELLFRVATRVCMQLMELPGGGSIGDFIDALANVKTLCESPRDADLVKASAVLALAEKVLIAGMKLKRIDKKLMKVMAKNLKFSLTASDMSMLTALKEQVHVTRTQVEMLCQSGFA